MNDCRVRLAKKGSCCVVCGAPYVHRVNNAPAIVATRATAGVGRISTYMWYIELID
jgi:hypothetical protein